MANPNLRRVLPVLFSSALLVVSLGACGTAGTGRGADDARDVAVSDDPGVELVGDAVEVEPPEADEPGDAETVDTPVAGLALTFVDEWGDDGLTCEHSDTCAITVTPYGSRHPGGRDAHGRRNRTVRR